MVFFKSIHFREYNSLPTLAYTAIVYTMGTTFYVITGVWSPIVSCARTCLKHMFLQLFSLLNFRQNQK
jgi:hypothetical protein